MEFLMRNPLILLAGLLIVMALIVYVLVAKKPVKNKNKKDNKQKDEETNALSETEDDSKTEENVLETKTEKKEQKSKRKLKKLKPEIVRVYEKKQLQKKEEKAIVPSDLKEKEEQELLKKMQFVKTSKTVSRLKPYTIDELNENLIEENNVNADEVKEAQNLVSELEKSTHFDRTRRLSKMIKEDAFDDMFCSHISEKYMNMDALERHIRNCDEIQNKLFDRAAKTIAYSKSKVSISEDGKINQVTNKDKDKVFIEEKRREELAKMMIDSNQENKYISEDELIDNIHDDFDLSARNVLIVDSILNRKGKKNVKK